RIHWRALESQNGVQSAFDGFFSFGCELLIRLLTTRVERRQYNRPAAAGRKCGNVTLGLRLVFVKLGLVSRILKKPDSDAFERLEFRPRVELWYRDVLVWH